MEVQQISNINILHPKFQICDLTDITDRERRRMKLRATKTHRNHFYKIHWDILLSFYNSYSFKQFPNKIFKITNKTRWLSGIQLYCVLEHSLSKALALIPSTECEKWYMCKHDCYFLVFIPSERTQSKYHTVFFFY